jgi:hypothetical protein
MQFNGPLAASSQQFKFAVSPETKVVPQRDRTPNYRKKSKLRLLLIALAISAVVPGAAHATAGTLTASLSSASFGSVPVGSKSSQAVLLRNTGGAALKLISVSLSGTGFSETGLVIPLSLTLAVGQMASFTITFAPPTTGSVTGELTLHSTAINSTLAIALSGTGVTTTRTISLSTASLNFGNEVVGGTSTLAVTLKNTGNSSVTVSGVSVAGTGFSVSNGTGGATLAAGQTADLNVVFAPKATGNVSGTVSILSNASNSPNRISVSGAGVSSTAHSVTLNWEASSSSNVIGYYAYRSTVSGGSYSRLTSSPVTALRYADGTVIAGETYYYVVTAVNATGTQSGYSVQVRATIP